ncbi:hypothetical protein ACI6Q2_12125 [Chitinophagaceae bacterium LWZ2-11]
MKKLIFLSFLLMGAFVGFSQQTTPPASQPTAKATTKQTQNPAAWACPKCYQINKAGGKCTADNTDMVQLGTYYCEHCVKATGAKPGKCPTCSGVTTQMTRKLCAQHNKDSMPTKKAA